MMKNGVPRWGHAVGCAGVLRRASFLQRACEADDKPFDVLGHSQTHADPKVQMRGGGRRDVLF